MRKVLDHFRNEVRRQLNQISDESLRENQYPKQWILTLTKADLFPSDFSAQEFERRVVTKASHQLKELADELQAPSLGHQFLLLSAAVGEGDRVVDADRTLGLELIAPVTLVSILIEAAHAETDRSTGKNRHRSTRPLQNSSRS